MFNLNRGTTTQAQQSRLMAVLHAAPPREYAFRGPTVHFGGVSIANADRVHVFATGTKVAVNGRTMLLEEGEHADLMARLVRA